MVEKALITLVIAAVIIILTIFLLTLYVKFTPIDTAITPTSSTIILSDGRQRTTIDVTYETGLGTLCTGSCPDGMSCQGICKMNEGGQCRIAADCVDDLNCIDGTCTKAQPSFPCDLNKSVYVQSVGSCLSVAGQRCTNNNQCASNNCVSAVCVDQDIGQQCNESLRCTPPLVCRSGTCTFPPQGPQVNQCSDGNSCRNSTQRCISSSTGFSQCKLGNASLTDPCRRVDGEDGGVCRPFLTCSRYGNGVRTCSVNTPGKDINNYNRFMQCPPGYTLSGTTCNAPPLKAQGKYSLMSFNRQNLNTSLITTLDTTGGKIIYVGYLPQLTLVNNNITTGYVIVFQQRIVLLPVGEDDTVNSSIVINSFKDNIVAASSALSISDPTAAIASTSYLTIHYGSSTRMFKVAEWSTAQPVQAYNESTMTVAVNSPYGNKTVGVSVDSNLAITYGSINTSKSLIETKSRIYTYDSSNNTIKQDGKDITYSIPYTNITDTSYVPLARVLGNDTDGSLVIAMAQRQITNCTVGYPLLARWSGITTSLPYPYSLSSCGAANPSVNHSVINGTRSLLSMSSALTDGGLAYVASISAEANTSYLELSKFNINAKSLTPSVVRQPIVLSPQSVVGVGIDDAKNVLILTSEFTIESS